MDLDDLLFCRDYFSKVGRDPTITEIKVIDTYWSDHCRHTTFLTTVDSVRTDEEVAARAEHYRGQLAAYAEALTRIFGKSVKEGVLFFLAPGKAVRLF